MKPHRTSNRGFGPVLRQERTSAVVESTEAAVAAVQEESQVMVNVGALINRIGLRWCLIKIMVLCTPQPYSNY